LETCAVSGSADNLVAVSPRSGRAVSETEAEPYAGKLLPLPRFVREGGQASWSDIADGLDLTGHFLMRDLLTQKSAVLGEARSRLVDRLRRAGGLA
jgi:DNA repair protein RecO (recombination protein O)